MTDMHAPNQQAVRGDGSGPEEEGTGGSPPVEGSGGTEPGPVAEAEPETQANAETDPLDDMTKDELIEEASTRGIDVNAAMTKAEIRAAIDAG